MALTLYWFPASAPCRAVLMTIRALQIDVQLKHVDILKDEQHSPEFVKINPQHTVPTIVEEDGFTLWESRAINAYLSDKYGKDDSLYPKDPKERAVVDRLLNFDNGMLYTRINDWIMPQISKKEKPSKEQSQLVHDVLDTLDSLLYDNKYTAGEQLTIADHSIIASLGYLDMVPFDFSQWMHIYDYLERCKSDLPYWKECYEGVKNFKENR